MHLKTKSKRPNSIYFWGGPQTLSVTAPHQQFLSSAATGAKSYQLATGTIYLHFIQIKIQHNTFQLPEIKDCPLQNTFNASLCFHIFFIV